MNQIKTNSPTGTNQVSNARDEAVMLPPVDVIEDAAGITLYADMPGASKENLNLHVEDDALTIDAALALEVPQGMEATHAEVSLARYHRVFTLSKELDADKIAAEFDRGVLKLRIPKAEHAQPRKITVSVA